MQIMTVCNHKCNVYASFKKLTLMMKFTLIFVFLFSLQAMALESLSQRRVSVNHTNARLTTVLDNIQNKYGYRFVYKENSGLSNVRVSIQANNETIDRVVTKLLEGSRFTYHRVNSSLIAISVKNDIKPDFPVTGKITDRNGNPLSGANVRIINQNRGTTSDEKGNFSLNAQGENAVLEVSYIGYSSKEVQVSSGSGFVEIILELAGNILDETVVVAYGTTSKRLNTGNVSSVSEKVISAQPVGNPVAALQGRVPGMMITASNGMPGSNFQVRIRGENSMKQGNEPLYIVDGVPFNSIPLNQFSGSNGEQSPLNAINPADIERIDILKDADATAIYGSRGANGVILIKTKKGTAGTTKVDASFYTGISKISNKMEMLNTQQYLQMRRDAFRVDSVAPTAANAPDLLEWDQNKYTDWQELLIGKEARLSEAQVAVRGGNQQTRYLLSGTYRREEAVVLGDFYYKKGGVLLGLDHRNENGKFGISASLNYTTDYNNSAPTDVSQYFYFAPNFPIYNNDGSLYFFGTGENPLAYLNRTYETRTNAIMGNSVISYKILSDLEARVNLGVTQMGMEQIQTMPAAGFNPQTFTGSSSQFGTSGSSSYIVEPQLEYKKQIGAGALNFLVGSTFQELTRKGHYVLASGFASEVLLRNIGSAGTITPRSSSHSQYNYTSVFGRINYQLQNRYIFNGTFRRDGSSRFGPGNQFGNFGALGAAWLFNEEEFIKNAIPFLSYGKLRGSIGVTGNDQIGDYQFLDSWGSTTFPYDGSGGLTPSRVFNPNYSWETNKKIEAGLELGFLNDRILLSASYYNNRSGNQLIGVTLAAQSGFTSYIDNSPAKVQNSGLEFELNTQNIKAANFEWNTNFNISFQRNKLLEYENLASSADAFAYEVGKSIRIIKGYHFTGINPQTGVPTFLDVNNSGTITEAGDYVIIGETLPRFFGGLGNELRYKDVSLEFFFQFVKQEGINNDYGPLAGIFGGMNNKRAAYQDYWKQPGDNVAFPRPSATSSKAAYTAYNNNWRYSNAAWEDASYIRLKNVRLAYNLTNLFKNKFTANIFMLGQNLLTFTKYTGLDPEINGFDRRFVYPVNPFGSVRPQALPVLKTVTIGFNVTI